MSPYRGEGGFLLVILSSHRLAGSSFVGGFSFCGLVFDVLLSD